MKYWDRAVPAEGIDLGVWMDAQADPEIVSSGSGYLVVDFPCWEPRPPGSTAPPEKASYRGRLRFAGVSAFRVLDGELAPYRFVYGESNTPQCLFEVWLSKYDPSRKITREASWFPSVRQEHDPGRWFAQLDAWDPEEAPPPALSPGVHHFVVVGHDSYVEVLASSYEFEGIPRNR